MLERATPRSKLLVLVRDPRDIVASALDGQREGAWAWRDVARGVPRRGNNLADTKPVGFARRRAEIVRRDFHAARQAYDQHSQGPRCFVRYEDLRADPVAELSRICAELELQAGPEELTKITAEHDFDRIPEADRGVGKFFRKATPGSWREDLMPKQIAEIERIAGDVLDALPRLGIRRRRRRAAVRGGPRRG